MNRTPTIHRLLNLLGALVIIALVAMLTWERPDPADQKSDAAEQAIAEHAEEIKMLRAAIEMCGGENAVAQDLGNGAWQCFDKHGRKTVTAEVTP